MKASDLVWSLIMTYPIWDRRNNKPLCIDLEGFNLLNRVYARIVKIENKGE